MTQSRMRILGPLTLSWALGLGGCQQENAASAHAAELESAPGIKVLITSAGDLSQEQAHAISQSAEGQAQDVRAATVRLQTSDGDDDTPPSLEIELWGTGLPDSAALVSQLKGEFPALATAQIEVVGLVPGSGPEPLAIEVSDAATPEEAEEQIREALEADGVEGAIEVQVEDFEDGRRVEVKVERHDP